MNLPLPTLGGRYLWTDRRIRNGWRVQRHTITGHHRLLDPRDVRRAWGSLEDSHDALGRLAGPAKPGEATVLVLHGLGRTRHAMRPLTNALRKSGWNVANFGYASTRHAIDHFASALQEVVEAYPSSATWHFVGHSLGNLIVRRLLARLADDLKDRVGRVVMLAPPNQGSLMARRVGLVPGILLGLGPAAREIVEWERTLPTLATPTRFGIIAGRYEILPNPLLDAAGDLIVTLEETRLEGAADFVEVPVSHTFIMNDPQVHELTDRFLRTERFLSQES